ncbi:MAG: Flp family type IVb pilin [Planctomycetota bacterium]
MIANTVTFLRRLRSEESGVTTVEYALLLALIMVFCISAILSAGDVQDALWFNTSQELEVINQ